MQDSTAAKAVVGTASGLPVAQSTSSACVDERNEGVEASEKEHDEVGADRLEGVSPPLPGEEENLRRNDGIQANSVVEATFGDTTALSHIPSALHFNACMEASERDQDEGIAPFQVAVLPTPLADAEEQWRDDQTPESLTVEAVLGDISTSPSMPPFASPINELNEHMKISGKEQEEGDHLIEGANPPLVDNVGPLRLNDGEMQESSALEAALGVTSISPDVPNDRNTKDAKSAHDEPKACRHEGANPPLLCTFTDGEELNDETQESSGSPVIASPINACMKDSKLGCEDDKVVHLEVASPPMTDNEEIPKSNDETRESSAVEAALGVTSTTLRTPSASPIDEYNERTDNLKPENEEARACGGEHSASLAPVGQVDADPLSTSAANDPPQLLKPAQKLNGADAHSAKLPSLPIIIHAGAQPNNSPHGGTIVVFCEAFKLAQKLEKLMADIAAEDTSIKVPSVEVHISLVDTAPVKTESVSRRAWSIRSRTDMFRTLF